MVLRSRKVAIMTDGSGIGTISEKPPEVLLVEKVPVPRNPVPLPL